MKKRAHSAAGAEILGQILWEIPFAYFRMSVFMERLTGWYRNSGKYGILRSLQLEGPQSVAQIARSRPVARQNVQRMADSLAAEGLIEWVENPTHKRAKLARLTPAGEALLGRIHAALDALSRQIAARFDERTLAATLNLLRSVREDFSKSPRGMPSGIARTRPRHVRVKPPRAAR
jgi:DNA-binding MarR family transcriptional regulator